jgi:hypothetical protein
MGESGRGILAWYKDARSCKPELRIGIRNKEARI